jgi:hypothetical protein
MKKSLQFAAVLSVAIVAAFITQIDLSTQVRGLLPLASVPNLPASQITSGQLALARGGTNADLSATGGASQVVRQSSAGAAFTVAQLAFTDLSGSASVAQIPNLPASIITSGQLALARGGTNADLSGTGGASFVLKQTSVGAAVTAAQLAFTDISGSVAASQLPNPTASTLGGIESYAAVSNQWINAISTSGVPSSTQPDFLNLTSAPFPSGGADTFPIPEALGQAANVNLALAAANAGYFVKVHVNEYINFTKATTIQPSGTTAGMNVFFGLYDLSLNRLVQIKFTTVNPGGATVTLVGTLTGNAFINPGTYYWLVACDTGSTVGTILGGPTTTSSYMTAMNLNGFGNAFKLGILSAGALANPLPALSGFTKTTSGQMGSSAIGVVYLEP